MAGELWKFFCAGGPGIKGNAEYFRGFGRNGEGIDIAAVGLKGL